MGRCAVLACMALAGAPQHLGKEAGPGLRASSVARPASVGTLGRALHVEVDALAPFVMTGARPGAHETQEDDMDPLQALTLTKLQLAQSQPQAPGNARRPGRQSRSRRLWHQRSAGARQALAAACGLLGPQGHGSLRPPEPTPLPAAGGWVASAPERD